MLFSYHRMFLIHIGTFVSLLQGHLFVQGDRISSGVTNKDESYILLVAVYDSVK